MSGQKTFNVTAGISTASQPGFFDGIASALQAYQERKRQEREAAIKREQDIQQKLLNFVLVLLEKRLLFKNLNRLN